MEQKQSLNQNAAEVTSLGYAGAASIYLVIVGLSLLFPVPWDTPLIIALTASVAVFASLGWCWMRVRPIQPNRSHLALFLLLSMMAIQNGAVLFLIAEPIHSGNQILSMMAAAFFLAARVWFYPAVAIILCCWLPAAVVGFQDEQFVTDWNQWSRMLVVSAALAIAFFEARRRSVLRIYRHKVEAETALAHAHDANESR